MHTILRNPGATSRDDAIFSGESLLQELERAWELTLTEPVRGVVEFRPTQLCRLCHLFCAFPNNISFPSLIQKKPTQSAAIVLTLWIHRTEEELKLHFIFGQMARKYARTVISRSFPRSVDIAAWPVQRRSAYRAKFQKLFNDRGKIRSNLGYSTSFPRNQKQQCRNRVH